MTFKAMFVLLMVALMSVGAPAIQAQDDEGVSGEGWTIVGEIPEEVIPTKFANGEADEDSCDIPGACWFFAEAGVLGADDLDDANANDSAVWTGGGDAQELLENETAQLLLPESGYMTVTGAGFDMTCEMPDGEFTLSLEAEDDHMWQVGVRGRTNGSGDRNVPCTFSNYTSGGVLVTLYAIPVEASAFFSQDYFEDMADNAHVRKNCGATGCRNVSSLVFDVNDGAYAVHTHTATRGYRLVETNTVADE